MSVSCGIGHTACERSATCTPFARSAAVARCATSHLSLRSRPKPKRFTSIERIAFWNASLKVRPIDIASPTDFICVVSVSSASGNFSKVQRGIFTTT